MEQEIEPPGQGQHIVRAVGSRGSNIIEVEFPDGRTTLCLLPAKFHKKLWIKKGNYLVIEEEEGVDGRVTGEILAVLFADHVKQLKKMPGVWPPEFVTASVAAAAAASLAADELAALGVAESDADEDSAVGSASPAAAGSLGGASASAGGEAAGGQQQASAQKGGGGAAAADSGSSSEDDLPPIPRFNNRKVVEYEVSDTDSDD